MSSAPKADKINVSKDKLLIQLLSDLFFQRLLQIRLGLVGLPQKNFRALLVRDFLQARCPSCQPTQNITQKRRMKTETNNYIILLALSHTTATCSSDFPKSPPLPRFGPQTEPAYIGSFGMGKPGQNIQTISINEHIKCTCKYHKD